MSILINKIYFLNILLYIGFRKIKQYNIGKRQRSIYNYRVYTKQYWVGLLYIYSYSSNNNIS